MEVEGNASNARCFFGCRLVGSGAVHGENCGTVPCGSNESYNIYFSNTEFSLISNVMTLKCTEVIIMQSISWRPKINRHNRIKVNFLQRFYWKVLST